MQYSASELLIIMYVSFKIAKGGFEEGDQQLEKSERSKGVLSGKLSIKFATPA